MAKTVAGVYLDDKTIKQIERFNKKTDEERRLAQSRRIGWRKKDEVARELAQGSSIQDTATLTAVHPKAIKEFLKDEHFKAQVAEYKEQFRLEAFDKTVEANNGLHIVLERKLAELAAQDNLYNTTLRDITASIESSTKLALLLAGESTENVTVKAKKSFEDF